MAAVHTPLPSAARSHNTACCQVTQSIATTLHCSWSQHEDILYVRVHTDSELMSNNNTTVNKIHYQNVSTRRSLSTAYLAIGTSSVQLNSTMSLYSITETQEIILSPVSPVQGLPLQAKLHHQNQPVFHIGEVSAMYGMYVRMQVCIRLPWKVFQRCRTLSSTMRTYMEYILRISLSNYHDEYLRSFNSVVWASVDSPCW